MVVSVTLEPTASVDYADLGNVLGDAVRVRLAFGLPANERADTAVTVTLSESATGTFSLGAGASVTSLLETVTEKACAGAIACGATHAVENGARRRLATTATYTVVRTFAPDAGVVEINAVFTQAAAEEAGVTDAGTTSATLSAHAAVEREAASSASSVDDALADPAAVASIRNAVQTYVAGAGRRRRRHSLRTTTMAEVLECRSPLSRAALVVVESSSSSWPAPSSSTTVAATIRTSVCRRSTGRIVR